MLFVIVCLVISHSSRSSCCGGGQYNTPAQNANITHTQHTYVPAMDRNIQTNI